MVMCPDLVCTLRTNQVTIRNDGTAVITCAFRLEGTIVSPSKDGARRGGIPTVSVQVVSDDDNHTFLKTKFLPPSSAAVPPPDQRIKVKDGAKLFPQQHEQTQQEQQQLDKEQYEAFIQQHKPKKAVDSEDWMAVAMSALRLGSMEAAKPTRAELFAVEQTASATTAAAPSQRRGTTADKPAQRVDSLTLSIGNIDLRKGLCDETKNKLQEYESQCNQKIADKRAVNATVSSGDIRQQAPPTANATDAATISTIDIADVNADAAGVNAAAPAASFAAECAHSVSKAKTAPFFGDSIIFLHIDRNGKIQAMELQHY